MNMKLRSLTVMPNRHKGNTLVGVIVGLVIGLGVALGVAFYISKAPVNFSQKNQNRSAEQDAQEARKNRDWDPNAALHGKNPVKPASPPQAVPVQQAVPPGVEVVRSSPAATATQASAKPSTEVKTTAPEVRIAPKSADPIGDLAKAKTQGSATTPADPFVYFVQAGAYRSTQEADAQRAKLALTGLDAKVSGREQSGYMVYRVRIGPIDKREEADRVRDKLEASGTEAVLIRVNR